MRHVISVRYARKTYKYNGWGFHGIEQRERGQEEHEALHQLVIRRGATRLRHLEMRCPPRHCLDFLQPLYHLAASVYLVVTSVRRVCALIEW